MAVLKLLAGATGTRIVTSWHLVLDDWRTRLLGTCVLSSCGSLIGVSHLFLCQVMFLANLFQYFSCFHAITSCLVIHSLCVQEMHRASNLLLLYSISLPIRETGEGIFLQFRIAVLFLRVGNGPDHETHIAGKVSHGLQAFQILLHILSRKPMHLIPVG